MGPEEAVGLHRMDVVHDQFALVSCLFFRCMVVVHWSGSAAGNVLFVGTQSVPERGGWWVGASGDQTGDDLDC